MTLKLCPCCKTLQTTKNAKKLGRHEMMPGMPMLYFNCTKCNSTFTLINKPKFEKVVA